ncbi:MAG: LytTR family DNA-binding domain-containing protein [Clostridiales bacterium]|nr:LytTR family DNA-binding domain-containing protein [Clostridiales bacterium]
MKILIIEDEQPNFLRLKKLLNDIDPTFVVEDPLISQSAVREYFAAGNKPDLIISDIRLSDGLVFDAFDDTDCDTRIIFTTAYSEYAVKAFQYNSIHYLLKPIVKEELAAAIKKAVVQIPERLSEIKQLTAPALKGAPLRRFLVPFRDGFEIIRVDDVAFLKYDCGMLRLYCLNGDSYALDMSIDECEMQLDEDMFFRANRQFIVNINAIRKLINYWDRKLRVVLAGFPDEEILVSRDKSKQLRDWLDR